MTSVSLARSYFVKAAKRLRALETLFAEEAWSDVVRQAQELVELAAKGMLRFVAIEPPKQHDVGPLLLQHRDRCGDARRTVRSTGRLLVRADIAQAETRAALGPNGARKVLREA